MERAHLPREIDQAPAPPRARVQPNPLADLARAAGNAAVAAAVQRPMVVQRSISVAKETWSRDEAREFRRELMLQLKVAGYRDLGTKTVWQQVDLLLFGDADNKFDSWPDLIDKFVKAGWLDKTLPKGGQATGPRSLGVRPKWRPDTAKAIATARGDRKGLAARHVIASSTLGLAVERANADLATLNAFLTAHGDEARQTDADAKRAVWEVAHNFPGNLWMGDTGANTAIGFVRTPLLDVKKAVTDPPDVDAVRALVMSKRVTGGQDNSRNRTWNLLFETLDAELGELGKNPSHDAVIDLVDLYYVNADTDLPVLTPGEYERIVKVAAMLRDPATVLPGLVLLLSKPLTHSIAQRAPVSAT